MKTIIRLLVGLLLMSSSAIAGPTDGFDRINPTATIKGTVTAIDHQAEKLVLKDFQGKAKVLHAYPKKIRDLDVGDIVKVKYFLTTRHVTAVQKVQN